MPNEIIFDGPVKKVQKNLITLKIERIEQGVNLTLRSELDFSILKDMSKAPINFGNQITYLPRNEIKNIFNDRDIVFNVPNSRGNKLFDGHGKINLACILVNVPLNQGVVFSLTDHPYSKETLIKFAETIKEKIKLVYQEIFSPVKTKIAITAADLY